MFPHVYSLGGIEVFGNTQQLQMWLQLATITDFLAATCNNYENSACNMQQLAPFQIADNDLQRECKRKGIIDRSL